MNCPACHHRQRFLSWLLRPGPRRRCDHCGAFLRYRGFVWQLGGNAILGACFALLWVGSRIPTATVIALAAATLLLTAVILPWLFARYHIDTEARASRGRWFWWTVATVITTLALFYAYENRRGAVALQTALANLEERGESLQLTDIYAPTPVAEQENVAAAQIVSGLFKKPQESALTKVSVPWKEAAKPPKSIQEMAMWIQPGFKGDDITAAGVVLDALASQKSALAELESALRRPGVYWPLNDYTDYNLTLPHLASLQDAARVLFTRARASLVAGATDQAAADTVSLFRLSEVIGETPLLITRLVSRSILDRAQQIVEEGLQQKSWNTQNLAQWESLLRTNNLYELAQALRLERVAAASFDWKNTNALFSGETRTRAFQAFLFLRPSGWANLDKAFYLEAMQKGIDQTQSQQAGGKGTWGVADNVGLVFRLQHVLSLMILPPFESIHKRFAAADEKSRKLQEACQSALQQPFTQRQAPSLLTEPIRPLPVVPENGVVDQSRFEGSHQSSVPERARRILERCPTVEELKRDPEFLQLDANMNTLMKANPDLLREYGEVKEVLLKALNLDGGRKYYVQWEPQGKAAQTLMESFVIGDATSYVKLYRQAATEAIYEFAKDPTLGISSNGFIVVERKP